MAAFRGDPLNGPDTLYEHLGLQFGNDNEQQLMQLNRDSFAAEDHSSADKMAPLLDDDFKIVRSTWEIEDKAQMLERVANDTSGRQRAVDKESVQLMGESAVVVSRVTVREANGTDVGRFWNTKVCVKRDGRWKCSTWQVSRIPH